MSFNDTRRISWSC